jgi:DNA-binding LacI/PurR family transcriptional regulator
LSRLDGHKYQELARKLMRHIHDSRLQPGDKLGTEDELGRAYKVSRVTVRQALSLLQQDGVVSRKKRAGTLIASAVEDERLLSDWRSTVVVLCSNQLASHVEDYAAFATVLRSLEMVLASGGYRVQIMGIGGNQELDRMRLQRLSRQSDVTAICAIDLSLQPYLKNLPEMPVVSTRWSSDPAIVSVGPDWSEGARVCVSHLIERGHRDIAMICGAWIDRQIFGLLASGYRTAMSGGGQILDRGFLHHCCPGEELDDAVREILTGRATRPTAVFAENSFVCESVIRVVAEMKMEIPRDLSLVGFGQNVMHVPSPARITAYVPNNEAIGREAAKLIAKLVSGDVTPQVVSVTGKLTEGGTVASLGSVEAGVTATSVRCPQKPVIAPGQFNVESFR